MIRIGITGKSGFIGTHLSNAIYLKREKYKLINFENEYFDDNKMLNEFVKNCDVLIHLAALNRHNDPNEIYRINISLVEKLINSLEFTQSKPHIIFASSTQEEKDNPYGNSKRMGKELIEKWAGKSGGSYSCLIIPNVFGPFCNPFYNSFIATFSHQLCRNIGPNIEVDSEIGLIYVDELVKKILQIIDDGHNRATIIKFAKISRYKVSEVLRILNNFSYEYFQQGIIPSIDSEFERNLFNTFRSYIDLKNYYPYHYKLNKDDRGIFVETMKFNSGGQVSYSTTNLVLHEGIIFI